MKALKQASNQTKTRWIAGLVYALFFVYQLMFVHPVITMSNTAFVNVPWLYLLEILALVPLAAAVVWLFAGEGAAPEAKRRGIAAATVLYVLCVIFTYKAQAEFAQLILGQWFPVKYVGASISAQNILTYIVVVLRPVMAIVAAFFVLTSKDEGSAGKSAQAEGCCCEAEADKQDPEANLEQKLEELEELAETLLEQTALEDVAMMDAESAEAAAETLEKMEELADEIAEEAAAIAEK